MPNIFILFGENMNELENYLEELPEIDKLYLVKQDCFIYQKNLEQKIGDRQARLAKDTIVLLLRIEKYNNLERMPLIFRNTSEPDYYRFFYLIGKEEKYHISTILNFKKTFTELDKAYDNNYLYYQKDNL